MQKNKIIVIISLVILLIAAFFGWKIFSIKKSVSINLQTEADSQQSAENNQQTSISNQEQTTSHKSSVISNSADEKTNAPQPKVDSSQKSSSIKIVANFVSWGFKKADSRLIDTIVIHSNYNTLSDDPYSISGAIDQFKMYGVAAHYIIDRAGTIYQLVAEKNIAYHAGVSQMKDGRTDVNNFSIGIELMVKDFKDSPTDAQYKALNSLISDIKKRWPIKYVVGHSDIAPGRKTDPWGMEWDKVQK